MQAIKLLWLLQGLPRMKGFNYNKKAGKCPGRSYGESACCKRCQQRRQRPFCYGRILYWRCCPSYKPRQFQRI
jgi:hypothetical protein